MSLAGSERITFSYCLIASQADYFAEMAAVSISTLRAEAPNAHITALLDQTTDMLETPAMALVRNMTNDWLVEELDPSWSAVERSRHLTLNMREIIRGHIVQLDADTLIARDPSDIVEHSHDFAAVADIYRMPEGRLLEIHREQGWEICQPYINGGVWSARDTEAMRGFFKEAHKAWREGFALGAHSDQYAISRTLKKTGLPISWLPLKYNFYTSYLGKTYMRPSIYHVFTGGFEERADTLLHVLAHGLKADGRLDADRLKRFAEDKNPWTKLEHPKQYWALGRPLSAAGAKLRKMIAR